MKQRKPRHSTISDQLRDAIRNSDMSVYKISQATGIAHRVIGKFLDGKHLTTRTADTLAEFLGLVLVFDVELLGETRNGD